MTLVSVFFLIFSLCFMGFSSSLQHAYCFSFFKTNAKIFKTVVNPVK